MAAVPFRTKKGDTWSAWKAVLSGKLIELAGPEATKEEAEKALSALAPEPAPESPKRSIKLSLKSTDPIAPAESTDSTPSTNSTSEKPKPGEFRKEGLAELSPARIAKFREHIALAIASGNVTLDRALVAIFRDNVPIIPPDQYALLSMGWELACEQYFVNGVPPAWVIILLGNAMVCTAMYDKSIPKKEEEPRATRADGNPAYEKRPATDI